MTPQLSLSWAMMQRPKKNIYSLEKGLWHMVGVDLMRLGHDWARRRLRVSLRHCASSGRVRAGGRKVTRFERSRFV